MTVVRHARVVTAIPIGSTAMLWRADCLTVFVIVALVELDGRSRVFKTGKRHARRNYSCGDGPGDKIRFSHQITPVRCVAPTVAIRGAHNNQRDYWLSFAPQRFANTSNSL